MSIGGLLAGKALSLAIDHALDGAISQAIAKASAYRSRRFIDALIEVVRLELDHNVSEDELNDLLGKLVKEANSEAVFDACRRACLSRSKDLGPRIIALLTAVLLSEERGPSDEEEMILDVAERLNDNELKSAVSTIRRWEQELISDPSKKVEQRHGELRKQVDKVQLSDDDQGEVGLGSRLLWEFGVMGERMRGCGLVEEYVEQARIHWKEDSERHIDEDGSATQTTWIIAFQPGYRSLADYVERAQRAIEAPTLE
jgi:hypothetical protein